MKETCRRRVQGKWKYLGAHGCARYLVYHFIDGLHLTKENIMNLHGAWALVPALLLCMLPSICADDGNIQPPPQPDSGQEGTEQTAPDLVAGQGVLQKPQEAEQQSLPEAVSEKVEEDPTSDTKTHDRSADTRPAVEAPRFVLQAIGAHESTEDEHDSPVEQKKDESWTEQTDTGNEQKRDGGRRFFSLMNLIKFILNPVIEEFQEVEKSNSSEISGKSSVTSNSSETTEKDESRNSTDSSKKTKFHCVGRNVTENTTALVRVVNSTVLLELLSFDKNQTVSDCVLVMFYAPWCHFCAATAPHYNALARAFPQLDVLAVDTVHFSNLNARFGTVAVPNIMLFHQSRSAVRFNHTERHFDTLVQFIKNTTGLEPNSTVTVMEEDYDGPLSSTPTEETDYLLWFAWIFLVVCGGHLFVQSQPGQRAIERVKILWQEHQHIE